MTPEKRIQMPIINYLKDLKKEGFPVYVERRQAGGFNYKMGIADLYAVINGIHIEIEVKKPGGSLGIMQEKWRDECKKLNIHWLCVDSIEDFKLYIKNFLSNI